MQYGGKNLLTFLGWFVRYEKRAHVVAPFGRLKRILPNSGRLYADERNGATTMRCVSRVSPRLPIEQQRFMAYACLDDFFRCLCAGLGRAHGAADRKLVQSGRW